jgi:glycosyltransferase 2 family protein
MKRVFTLIIGILISIFFLYIGIQGIDLSRVWHEITQANILWLIPGVIVYFLAVWGRTWRWHYLLRPIQPIPLKRLFPVVVIGYMGNNVYPFRAGEVIRAYVLKRNESVKITSSLATIIVERIFDGLVMLIFVFAALPFSNIEQPWLHTMVVAGTLVFFAALTVFLFMAARPILARHVYNRIIDTVVFPRFRETIRGIADHFMEGLESLRSPRDLMMTLITSIFIWLTETTKYWFVMHAFNFEVSFFVLMLMTGVVNLATTLPGAPGHVGTFHGPGILILEAFGVNHEIAASYTFVLHAALWLPVTLLGFFYLFQQGLSWRSFREAEQEAEQADRVETHKHTT